MRRSIQIFAASIMAGALALGGCGVPVDRSPAALNHAFPPYLVTPHPTTTSTLPATTTTSLPKFPLVPVSVYFIGPAGHLVAVTRDVNALPAVLDTTLDALISGPTPSEASSGLSSQVPSGTQVLSTSIAGGIATVNLSSAFSQSNTVFLVEAVAEVVYTATDLPGITGVAFEIAGNPVKVPSSAGVPVSPATRSDYAQLAPSS